MTRVALYARYSSDNQRDASIEDQLRICREKAEREKWTIVSTYKDAGISGASMILRPGIQTLLQDAQRQQFDVVLAEALDRISRDQADVATLFKHLRFAGVPIITLAEGEISELHVGLKGTMDALFLKDLVAKTHRGLRVEDGKSGGGLCCVDPALLENILAALQAAGFSDLSLVDAYNAIVAGLTGVILAGIPAARSGAERCLRVQRCSNVSVKVGWI